MHIVAIRDTKTDSFFTPQFVRSIGGFLRQLGDDITRPQPGTIAETMKLHPDQFEAWHLGDWEDETGESTAPEGGAKKRLVIISDLI